jgi:hypothetical protein
MLCEDRNTPNYIVIITREVTRWYLLQEEECN